MSENRKRERNNSDNYGWGEYMEAKKSKLIDQFKSEATRRGLKEDDLFKGISIFVNGYSDPSADELRCLMMKHGGEYHHYHQSQNTTYIIATNLPDSKLKLAQQFKVLKPSWVVDSIKQNKLQDYRDHLLITNRTSAQPSLAMKQATDKGFLEEFYSNSRLHHISTIGATFKKYISQLRLSNCDVKTLPGVEELLSRPSTSVPFSSNETVIMHIDMDCFFVSVALRSRPDLLGKPVAVTHSKTGQTKSPRKAENLEAELNAYAKRLGTTKVSRLNLTKEHDSMAEIASCSYEARALGVRNGTFVGQALRLCPDLHLVPYDFESYTEVSYKLYDSVARYTLEIEAVSCDELFADCTELCRRLSIDPMNFATILRKEIKEKTGCSCSVGFGSSKLIARLATKKAKPNGQYYLTKEKAAGVLESLAISDIPGVGRSTAYKLREKFGVHTCGEMQVLTRETLQSEFGAKMGLTLYNHCRGIDARELVFDQVRKSVSAEVNYGIRFQNSVQRDAFLKNLAEEVERRLKEVPTKGRNISLKLMIRSKDAPLETAKFMGHGVCDHITKSVNLNVATDDASVIYREISLLVTAIDAPPQEIRGIGVQVSKLNAVNAGSPVKSAGSITDFFARIKQRAKQSPKASPVKWEPPKIVEISPITIEDAKITDTEKELPKTSDVKTSSDEMLKRLTVDQVHNLMYRWVQNEVKPRRKDSRMVSNYLTSLVGRRRFQTIEISLKKLWRWIVRFNKPDLWEKAYEEIVASVQQAMHQVFNCPLKIDNISLID